MESIGSGNGPDRGTDGGDLSKPPADDHAFTSGKKTTPTQKPTPTVHQKNDGACNGSNLSTACR